MKTYLLSLLLCLFTIAALQSCAAPIDDEEETGKKEENPGEDPSYLLPWEGETGKFTINSKVGIRLNDTGETANTAYVTTPSATVTTTRWEFGVRLTFNPSANNYARFYLASSSPTLSGPLNGYFLQIGGKKDNVSLYRQEKWGTQLLLSGREIMKGNSSPKLRIKIECDANGYWKLYTRLETEEEYVAEKPVRDRTFGTSVCCGIFCVYTASRCKAFTFHHLRISNDVKTTTAPDASDPQPELPPEPENPRNMLLFNEVMYHNASNGAEYIELYNPTDSTVSLPYLLLYKMKASGEVFHTTKLQHEDSASPLVIPSKSYICFTASVTALQKKHAAEGRPLMQISSFPKLSDSGGYLAIVTARKKLIDKCTFADSLHTVTPAKKRVGVSLEKTAPELSSVNKHWRSSAHATGGTPGRKNTQE